MRNALGLFAVVVVGCASTAAVAPKPAATRPPIAWDGPALERWLGEQLVERGVVGAAVVVVRDGQTVLARGYGTRVAGQQAAVTVDTPFAIGSVTKQLTCAAAYLLADQGKLALTDPVARWYPQLPRAAEVTLADLGAHVAGYRDYYPLDYRDARMAAAIAPDALIAEYGAHQDFAPRARLSYSNTGYVVLGRVIEKVSGMGFGAFLAANVFQPLGMAHSAFGAPPAGAAEGHTALLRGPVERAVPEADGWALGAFGVYASAADLARWDVAFASGAILSEAARRALASPTPLSDGRTAEYSCGLGVRRRGGELVLGHAGAVEGFFAFNAIIPRTRSAVVLLVNDARRDVGDLHDLLVDRLLQRPADVPAVAGATPEEAARAVFEQLQRGQLDRARLGADLNGVLDARRLAEVAPRMRALGTPKITLRSRSERGGLEVTRLDFELATQTLEVVMFREPGGTIRQFQFSE